MNAIAIATPAPAIMPFPLANLPVADNNAAPQPTPSAPAGDKKDANAPPAAAADAGNNKPAVAPAGDAHGDVPLPLRPTPGGGAARLPMFLDHHNDPEPQPEEKHSPAAPLPWQDYPLSLLPLSAALAHEALIFSHSWQEPGVDEYVARVNAGVREMYPLLEAAIVLIQRAAACARLHVLEDFEGEEAVNDALVVVRYEEMLLRHLRPVGEICWKATKAKGTERDLHGELVRRTIGAVTALVQKRRRSAVDCSAAPKPMRA